MLASRAHVAGRRRRWTASLGASPKPCVINTETLAIFLPIAFYVQF